MHPYFHGGIAVIAAAAVVFPGSAAKAQPAPEPRRARTVAPAISGEPGAYTVDRWKKDWPGCGFEGGVSEGRVSVRREGDTAWLGVECAPGEIGPDKGGAGWRWPFGASERAELHYSVRFDAKFDFVKGGKLPGLAGGPENVSGGRPANGANGFSARVMWRRDGRGEAYVYHMHQPGKYGESFPFPKDFRFPLGAPVHVRIAVSMNHAGRRDGTLRVWIALDGQRERLMVEKTDMEWRKKATFGVDSLLFAVFHGGNDSSWAPSRPSRVEFTGFRVELSPRPLD